MGLMIDTSLSALAREKFPWVTGVYIDRDTEARAVIVRDGSKRQWRCPIWYGDLGPFSNVITRAALERTTFLACKQFAARR